MQIFQDAILSDLKKYNHQLPKKYIHLSNLKDSTIPVFKFRRFHCRNGDGSDFRIIFAVDRNELSIIFIELYGKKFKEDLDYNRLNTFFKLYDSIFNVNGTIVKSLNLNIHNLLDFFNNFLYYQKYN
ncbi:MAG: hypothetical protein LBM96_00280 [Methanobrevibacter sp.]|jgi:hypothetical protein|nr:hypothetical protein [Candidatus Methanoflexus mossambicus]